MQFSRIGAESSASPGGPRNTQNGAALVTVLWFLALAILLAATSLLTARLSARLSVNQLAVVEARALADSGIRRAILGVTESDPADLWPIDGKARQFKFHDRSVAITLMDESGRIDLNHAEPLLLAAAFAAQGVAVRDAEAAAARIVDWRDLDRVPLPLGNESAARNAPFESVGELYQVPGIPQQALRALSDAFTVYTAQRSVNAASAAPAVQAALVWADARQWGGRRWFHERHAGESAVADASGRVVRIRVEVASPGPLTREAIVRITGNARAPIIVLAWSDFAGE